MMSRMFVLALAVYCASAVPLVERLDDPTCVAGVPATTDPEVVKEIYLAALAKNADNRVRPSIPS
jgi:hypothetical protein